MMVRECAGDLEAESVWNGSGLFGILNRRGMYRSNVGLIADFDSSVFAISSFTSRHFGNPRNNHG
jgi:hypothetical protein